MHGNPVKFARHWFQKIIQISKIWPNSALTQLISTVERVLSALCDNQPEEITLKELVKEISKNG